MAHQRAPGADSDPDDIWHYVARESGNTDRAEHFIASITEPFYMLAASPYIGRVGDALRHVTPLLAPPTQHASQPFAVLRRIGQTKIHRAKRNQRSQCQNNRMMRAPKL